MTEKRNYRHYPPAFKEEAVAVGSDSGVINYATTQQIMQAGSMPQVTEQ